MARQVNVPKLEDAHLAGTERSGECSLVLTEGDSAKALAVAGLSVVGRDTFGVRDCQRIDSLLICLEDHISILLLL